MAADPTYIVGLELVSGSFTEIQSDVMQVSISRDLGHLFNSLRPGTCSIEVKNQDGTYSPDNADSPYSGLLLQNIQLRVQATHVGSTRTLFSGFVDEYMVRPALDSPRSTIISARDQVKALRNRTVTTSIFVDVNVGSFFTDVLSEAEVSSRSVDAMSDSIPFGWFRDRQAQNAINEIIEAGFFFGFVDGAGILQIKDRYFDAIATTVGSYDEFYNLGYERNDDIVYNKISVEGEPRKQATAVGTVAYLTDAISIVSSGFVSFFLEYLDPDNLEPAPANEMVTPVTSSDYLANTLIDGTGTDRTSTTSVSIKFFGQTAVSTIFNGSSDAIWLTKYQIRGKSIQRKPRLSAVADDSSSEAVYGRRNFTLTNNLVGNQDFSQQYAEFLLARHKNPEASVVATFRNEFPDVLDIELGDIIHVTNSFLGVSSRESVFGIEHTISLDAGLVHQTTYRLDGYRDQNVLILNHADFGKLNERRLGF